MRTNANADRGMRHGTPFLPTVMLILALSSVTFGEQAPAAVEPRQAAVEQILRSVRSGDPFLRANAIEAAQPLSDRIVPLAQLALEDEHPAVRFAALASIGKLRLKELAPAAGRLVDDPDESVRAAALYALRATGRKVDLSPLAGMLQSPNPGVRSNVALLLGLLGDKSAAPMLMEMSRAPMPRAGGAQAALTRIQLAEAVVRLGDESALDAIRAGAYSEFDEVRVLSVQMMGRLGDRRMREAMVDMLARPPVELQLAAAEALARLGSREGLPVALTGARSELTTARAQAALVLGLFRNPQARERLAQLLNDPSEQVRLSAAAAVLGSHDSLAANAD